MCFPPDWLQGPELLLTSSWRQSHAPPGAGNRAGAHRPPRPVWLSLRCPAQPPWAEEEGASGKAQTSSARNPSGNSPSLFSPSLSPSQQWEAYGSTLPLLRLYSSFSGACRSHVVQLSLTLHPDLSYPFLLHSAPAIGLQSFPAHLFPTSGSGVPFPSCLTWNKALFLLHTHFLSNKMGWSFPTGGQEGGQFITLYQAQSGQDDSSFSY